MKSILLIKPGSFGDVIHALPCAAALKANYPNARLTWLIDDRWAPFLEGNPHVDATVVFPRRSFRGLGIFKALPWFASLGHLKPDLAIDLQGLMRSALMARFSGAKRIIGLSDAREGAPGFYHDLVPVIPGEHSVRRYLRVLETLGFPAVPEPQFDLPSGKRPARFATSESFVLLHPFARGAGKSLTSAQVVELCRLLAPIPVVLAGVGELTEPAPENAENLLNATSIEDLIWLIRAASFVVSVDSGPMHIAAAITPRLLSLHTWSDPRLVGPFNENAWIWQGGQIRHQDFQAAEIPAENRTPDEKDIRAIAEFVRAEF